MTSHPEQITAAATCAIVPLPDGAQLFSRLSAGNDALPPLVLLHGNRDNHTHFTELTELLAGARRCVSVDLRGHGLSSKEDTPLSAQQCSDDLLILLDHFGWRQVVLVGHSLGSVTSMVFAVDHPDRVAGLVLMGAAAHYEMKWKRPSVTEETYREVIKESNKRAAPFFFHPEHPDVAKRVIASWSWVPFQVHRNLIQLRHPDLRPRIGGIRTPTLVVAGAQDKSTPIDSARQIIELIPDSRMYVVEDSGHFMFMEHPAEVAEAISDFLATVDVPEPDVAQIA